MYVIATVSFPGDDSEYEVGADVEYEREPGPFSGYMVDEPEVSAPDCRLKNSRLIDPDTLPEGWSEYASEALQEAYDGAVGSQLDARADYEYDRMREEW